MFSLPPRHVHFLLRITLALGTGLVITVLL